MIRALAFRAGRGDARRSHSTSLDAAAIWSKQPARLPAWYVRSLKLLRRQIQQLRVMLRLRRGVKVAGVWYKELSATPMHRALQPPPRGPGFKDFRVTFPDGSKMVIRCSATEVYADLMGSVALEHLRSIAGMLRPGSRLLEIGAGSGYRAAFLSSVAGPSGSVVAIGRSRVPIDFAIRRYSLRNVAFEVDSPQSLSGETDGSFDGVVISEVVEDNPAGNAALEEAWRVLAPGGLLVTHEPLVPPPAPQSADQPGSPEQRALNRISAIHRKLGESGKVPLPRSVATIVTVPGSVGPAMMLAVFKPESSPTPPPDRSESSDAANEQP